MLKHWYSSEKDLSELRSRKLEAELKLKEAELQLLKGQIHPHFLFNTLNNLYGLALEQSEQMPDAIIRLSGMLDALLYRGQHQTIPLKTELKLMEDYISLEKLRLENSLELHWAVDKKAEAYPIAPFLLFPFIENAFKHGFTDTTGRLYLEITVAVKQEQLLFSVTNSLNKAEKPVPSTTGGIGLENVKRRLELLYPGQYHLRISPSAKSFTVQLSLGLPEAKQPTYANQ